jgi:D-alanine-D-alanine ligase
MEACQLTVGIVYNTNGEPQRGEPRDIIAIQETVEIAESIGEALSQLGYPYKKLPVRSSLDDLRRSLEPLSPLDTLIFNLCDDFGGASLGSARVAELIEGMGFMYTGETTNSIAVCMDKAQTKERLILNGVPTAPYQVFDRPQGDFSLKFPVIIKPMTEDASFGIDYESVAWDTGAVFARVAYIIEKYRQPAIVEEFMVGRELTVGLIGNETLEALPVSEIDFSSIDDPYRRILTYEAKWMVDSPLYHATQSICPADLSEKESEQVLMVASDAYRAVSLRDYGRIDIRYVEGIPFVIEVNEAPDLAEDAGFAKASAVAGYSYAKMIERILDVALIRHSYI